jgi:hypothetical protein
MVTGCSWDGTVSSQGVLHVWPWVVRTSAPGGSDSNFNVWSFSDEEFDDCAEEQPVSETPTAAATTTESAMRDMTSLLPIFCSAQLMKTLAQNVEMRRLLPLKQRFATRKMASVGAQGGIPQILGLCCFLDTRSARYARPCHFYFDIKLKRDAAVHPSRASPLAHDCREGSNAGRINHVCRQGPD